MREIEDCSEGYLKPSRSLVGLPAGWLSPFDERALEEALWRGTVLMIWYLNGRTHE